MLATAAPAAVAISARSDAGSRPAATASEHPGQEGPDEEGDLAEFLDASHGYHCHFVGLGGSPQLVDTYSRLGISTLWRRAFSEQDWRTRFDVAHHAALTRACRDGDVDQARRHIRDHTQQVRNLVRDVIDRAGGAL